TTATTTTTTTITTKTTTATTATSTAIQEAFIAATLTKTTSNTTTTITAITIPTIIAPEIPETSMKRFATKPTQLSVPSTKSEGRPDEEQKNSHSTIETIQTSTISSTTTHSESTTFSTGYEQNYAQKSVHRLKRNRLQYNELARLIVEVLSACSLLFSVISLGIFALLYFRVILNDSVNAIANNHRRNVR
ncbi:hypothetical protein Tcan_01811, partial [Toxocara canis]